MHFGNIDKTDFLIPPVALFYFYTIFAAAFGWPLVSAQRFFESEMVAWIGVGLCFGGLLMLLLSLVSFGASFRVGIDVDHPNKLVTAGIFAVSRNPIYVAFGLVLVGRIPGISELDPTDLRCCRNLVISPAGFAGGRIYAETVPWMCAVVLRGSRHHLVANSAHPGCFKGPTLDLGSRPTRSPRLRAGTSLTRVRSLVRVVTIQVSGYARQALSRKAFPIDPL